MKTTLLASVLYLALTTSALPELRIEKRNKHGARPVYRHIKRQNAIGTNVYDILTYSTGGAYYANSESLLPIQALRRTLLT